MSQVLPQIDELMKLCRQFFVEKLYVIGSVARREANQKSDLDLLVRFTGVHAEEYFDNYIDFKSKVEALYKCKVDLVEIQTIKNPILKMAIDKDKILLYERKNIEMAF